MEPFGTGGETYVHPAVALAMFVVGIVVFCVPRKYVIVPLLVAAFIIPMDQVVVLGTFHFQMLRILILLGWIRVIATKLSSGVRLFSQGWNAIDTTVTLWASVTAVNVVLLWQESAAFNNQLGTLYTVFGIYFLLRCLIRDSSDIDHAIRSLAYVAAIIAVIMVVEQATGRNPYAFLGGARAWTRETLINREDTFRAMGSFQHPILAGTFGGILLPFFIMIWRKDKRTAWVGAISATLIVITSHSSTPLLAYAAALVAVCLWPIREWMRPVRWGLFITLTMLHVVMKAPVWALVARIDLTGGSSSYHRFMLIDECIRHFGEWWLLGTKNFAAWGWDMWDLANQYVAIADTSGLLPLILFIAIIVFAFKFIGKSRKAARGRKLDEFYLWMLGGALFTNVVAFFGISYFDQTMVIWYALLAMVPAAGMAANKAVARSECRGKIVPQDATADYAFASAPLNQLRDLLEKDGSAAVNQEP